MTKTRSFLKWAGSKYNCLDKLLSALPKGKRLIEPFAGSGVVYMNTNYQSYLLAERNLDLIQCFIFLQKQGKQFIDYCEQYFDPSFNCKEKYYEFRSLFNQLDYSEQRSALFLYLNKHGFNGLCRYNSKGIFNVPFGRYPSPYFPKNEMLLFSAKSNQATFTHQDFRKTFSLAKPGDVIYCDPPYVPLIRNQAINYTKDLFTEADQIELAQLAKKSAEKGITVIISNHDTEFTRYHYKEAQIQSFYVSRFISCQGNNRNPVKELIAVYKS